ncbi:PIN domain-containing protein [Ferroglobus sp.]|uniref:PIN domain-containing protein n=1 Tax=Ferroglobus sp. TaxID=2614230 RepID=UPI0025BA1B3A|nr:PIN domain-containing protein [Ferroglobus sp.]
MLLVTDANVLFAALISGGGTFRVFVTNKILGKFRFVAPEYLFVEIRELLDELDVVLNFLEEQIEVIPFEEFEDKYDEVEKISPDPDDIPYFALALKLNCAIWTNDKKLKEQNAVKVYTTHEIMQMLKIY